MPGTGGTITSEPPAWSDYGCKRLDGARADVRGTLEALDAVYGANMRLDALDTLSPIGPPLTGSAGYPWPAHRGSPWQPIGGPGNEPDGDEMYHGWSEYAYVGPLHIYRLDWLATVVLSGGTVGYSSDPPPINVTLNFPTLGCEAMMQPFGDGVYIYLPQPYVVRHTPGSTCNCGPPLNDELWIAFADPSIGGPLGDIVLGHVRLPNVSIAALESPLTSGAIPGCRVQYVVAVNQLDGDAAVADLLTQVTLPDDAMHGRSWWPYIGDDPAADNGVYAPWRLPK